jgi:hypothetical protein
VPQHRAERAGAAAGRGRRRGVPPSPESHEAGAHCSVRRDDLPLNRTDGQGTRHAREALAVSHRLETRASEAHALAWPLTSRRPAALRTRAATTSRPSPSPTCSACAPGRPLPPRSQQALPADGPARASSGAPHHRHDDVPRDGHPVLAGAGGGGDEAIRVNCARGRDPQPAIHPLTRQVPSPAVTLSQMIQGALITQLTYVAVPSAS